MIWCLKWVCRLKYEVQLLAILCCIPNAFYSSLILSLTLLGLRILTSLLINSYWLHVHLVIHKNYYGKYSTMSLLVSNSIIPDELVSLGWLLTLIILFKNNIRSIDPKGGIAKKNLFVCMLECETP